MKRLLWILLSLGSHWGSDYECAIGNWAEMPVVQAIILSLIIALESLGYSWDRDSCSPRINRDIKSTSDISKSMFKTLVQIYRHIGTLPYLLLIFFFFFL